jgi:anti-anti-sigma factor
VVAPDGAARHLAGTGAGPLGLGSASDVPLAVGAAVLAPGEVLLLYSNGLIERPGRTRYGGQADLEVVAADAAANPALAARSGGTPAERVSHLTVELLTRSGYGDDVTTLAAWRPLAAPGPLDLERQAGPDAVAALRHALDDWLDALGIAFGDRQLAVLSVTEAVTNAVEHAYPPARRGPVRLQAAVSADGFLETRVSDRGRWREPDRTAGARGTVVVLRHRLHRQPMLAPLAVAPPAGPGPYPAFAAQLMAAGPVQRVAVAGPVDFSTADRLEGRLLTACRAGVLPLAVDLSQVTILASAGVRVLYQVAAQLAAHGQELSLIAEPGSPAAAVLDLAGLPRTPK